MSIQAVAWVLGQNIPDAAAKLVMIALANAYNEAEGRCYPSQARLASEASQSQRTVIRKLQWLEENGWIKVERAYGATGRVANSYYLTAMTDDDSLDAVSDNLSPTGNEVSDKSVSDTAVTHVSDTVVTSVSDTAVTYNKERNRKRNRKEGTVRDTSSRRSDVARAAKPPASTPKAEKRKATRLPEDWVLPDEWRDIARNVGIPEPRIDIEAAKMRNWSLSSTNGAKLNWKAAWRNWCQETADKAGFKRPGVSPSSSVADADWNARLFGYRKYKAWRSEWGARPGEPGCLVPRHLLVSAVDGRAA